MIYDVAWSGLKQAKDLLARVGESELAAEAHRLMGLCDEQQVKQANVEAA